MLAFQIKHLIASLYTKKNQNFLDFYISSYITCLKHHFFYPVGRYKVEDGLTFEEKFPFPGRFFGGKCQANFSSKL